MGRLLSLISSRPYTYTSRSTIVTTVLDDGVCPRWRFEKSITCAGSRLRAVLVSSLDPFADADAAGELSAMFAQNAKVGSARMRSRSAIRFIVTLSSVIAGVLEAPAVMPAV